MKIEKKRALQLGYALACLVGYALAHRYLKKKGVGYFGRVKTLAPFAVGTTVIGALIDSQPVL